MFGRQFRQSELAKSPELFSYSQSQYCVAAITGGSLRVGLHSSCRCSDRVGRLVKADSRLMQRIAAFFANPDKTVLLLRLACSLDNQGPRPVGAPRRMGNIGR